MAVASIASARPMPHTAAPAYQTDDHRRWRAIVLDHARHACERCGRINCRLFADHVVELQDGGAALDPRNGQALCGACHTNKTNQARIERMKR